MDLLERAPRDHAAAQGVIDAQWDRLMSNEPGATVEAIQRSLAGNHAPVRATGVQDDAAWLVVQAPTSAEVPSRKPAVTASGAATTSSLNATERWAVIRQLIGARALLAAKQTLAAAPGLALVRLVVVGPVGEPLVGATIARSGLAAADFRQDAWTVLDQVDTGLVVRIGGRSRALEAIELPAAYSQVLAGHG